MRKGVNKNSKNKVIKYNEQLIISNNKIYFIKCTSSIRNGVNLMNNTNIKINA